MLTDYYSYHTIACDLEGKPHGIINNDKEMIKPCGKIYNSGEIVECMLSDYLKCLDGKYNKRKNGGLDD